MTPRARVFPAASAASLAATPVARPASGIVPRVRIPRPEADARTKAEQIVDEARAQAAEILAQARARAEDAVSTAAGEARRALEADFAAKWIALRDAELQRFERDVAQVVPVAVSLAERLLGASLGLDGAQIAPLARTVLGEARGARRAVLEANPVDALALTTHLTHLTTDGLDLESVEVRADDSLARGELRLHTEMGTIDACLAPRFERLASALRDALRSRPGG